MSLSFWLYGEVPRRPYEQLLRLLRNVSIERGYLHALVIGMVNITNFQKTLEMLAGPWQLVCCTVDTDRDCPAQGYPDSGVYNHSHRNLISKYGTLRIR